MQAHVNLGQLNTTQDIRKLEQALEELYDLHDAVYETADPNGSLVAHRGKIAIYYDGSKYYIKINTDGDNTWQTIGIWEVDGSESQLIVARNIDMQSKKLISLAAGSANGDSVRYEQAVKSGDAAGGDLSGTYPNPTVVGGDADTLGGKSHYDIVGQNAFSVYNLNGYGNGDYTTWATFTNKFIKNSNYDTARLVFHMINGVATNRQIAITINGVDYESDAFNATQKMGTVTADISGLTDGTAYTIVVKGKNVSSGSAATGDTICVITFE